MGFANLLKDTVTLTKQTGVIVEGIKASVQKKKIIVMADQLLIEEGDIFSRALSNGRVEEYIVIDSGFYERTNGFPAHYQCDVEKTTAPKNQPSIGSITNYFNGANARYNHNSIDNSTNIAIEPSTLFEDIRKAVEQNVADDERRTVIIEMVNELEGTVGTPSFKDKYSRFIQGLGDHITVLTPFIPQLTGLL